MQHHQHRETFLQGVAETVRAKRRTPSTRDVYSTIETHRCKHVRHPDRSSHTHDQTQPVLSRGRQDAHKDACAALAPVAMWHWPHPARPVLRVSRGISRSISALL